MFDEIFSERRYVEMCAVDDRYAAYQRQHPGAEVPFDALYPPGRSWDADWEEYLARFRAIPEKLEEPYPLWMTNHFGSHTATKAQRREIERLVALRREKQQRGQMRKTMQDYIMQVYNRPDPVPRDPRWRGQPPDSFIHSLWHDLEECERLARYGRKLIAQTDWPQKLEQNIPSVRQWLRQYGIERREWRASVLYKTHLPVMKWLSHI
jgi:hypothetical protein